MSLTYSRNDPADMVAAIVPSDSADLPKGMCDSIYVGTGGDLTVVIGGTTVTYKNLPTCILSVRATRVKVTGTTAADMIAQYVASAG